MDRSGDEGTEGEVSGRESGECEHFPQYWKCGDISRDLVPNFKKMLSSHQKLIIS